MKKAHGERANSNRGQKGKAMETIPRKTADNQTRVQRARCIVEFIEGDVNRPPVVYPVGGSDEIDTAMCRAILERWGQDHD